MREGVGQPGDQLEGELGRARLGGRGAARHLSVARLWLVAAAIWAHAHLEELEERIEAADLCEVLDVVGEGPKHEVLLVGATLNDKLHNVVLVGRVTPCDEVHFSVVDDDGAEGVWDDDL